MTPQSCAISRSPRRGRVSASGSKAPFRREFLSPKTITIPTHARHATCQRPPELFSPIVTFVLQDLRACNKAACRLATDHQQRCPVSPPSHSPAPPRPHRAPSPRSQAPGLFAQKTTQIAQCPNPCPPQVLAQSPKGVCHLMSLQERQLFMPDSGCRRPGSEPAYSLREYFGTSPGLPQRGHNWTDPIASLGSATLSPHSSQTSWNCLGMGIPHSGQRPLVFPVRSYSQARQRFSHINRLRRRSRRIARRQNTKNMATVAKRKVNGRELAPNPSQSARAFTS